MFLSKLLINIINDLIQKKNNQRKKKQKKQKQNRKKKILNNERQFIVEVYTKTTNKFIIRAGHDFINVVYSTKC